MMDTLVVDGVLDSLEVIAKYILKLAKTAELNTQKTYKLRLAVDELATNIIIYGYQETGKTGVIKIQTRMTDQDLQVILEDTGPAFNPAENLERANSILDKSLDERPLGGLGIYLALEGVDHFAYERVGDYNRSLLTVNRQDHS